MAEKGVVVVGPLLGDRLRKAGPADAAAIRQLVRASYGHYVERIGREPKPMTADYARAVAEHDLWVLEENGGLEAVLELIVAKDHLLVENIAVRPERQGNGLGRQLMAFAEERAREHGLHEMRLYTNGAFVENIILYRSLGYQETHREDYQGSQVVFMSKRI